MAGLIVGNFCKPLRKYLEPAAKPEWFIKTAIEKKLILGSLGIGATLLIVLILVTGAYKF